MGKNLRWYHDGDDWCLRESKDRCDIVTLSEYCGYWNVYWLNDESDALEIRLEREGVTTLADKKRWLKDYAERRYAGEAE